MIDGINQLSGRALDLHWLPPVMPAGVKLVISSTVEQTLVDLRRRGWRELGMQPLKEREREAVVVRFLAEYHKALSPERVKFIAEDVKCSHPLFLRTLLEELRLFGQHDRIEAMIDHLLASTGTEDLFQRVLDRLEEGFNMRVVRDVMTLLWASKGGVGEGELAELTGVSRLKLSSLLIGLDYHLVRRDGLLSFFHDYLRRAVEKRYLSDEQKKRAAHEQLAAYFEQGPATLRATRELLHALESLGQRERLELALSEIERFEELWAAERNEVQRLWSTTEPSMIAAAYHVGLQQWQATPEEQGRGAVLGDIAELLEAVGAWQDAISIERERLLLAREQGDRAEEAAARRHLGWMLQLRGEYEESLAELSLARDLFAELDDRSGLARTIGNVGVVCLNRGGYDQALECFRQQESIFRDLGDRSGVAGAIGSLGTVHSHRREYDQALESHRQRESISRDLGDRSGAAGAMLNIGLVYADRGEYDQALECYGQVETIWRELGNRAGLASVIGNKGIVYSNCGKYDEALECYRQVETMSRDLGDRRGLAGVLNNMGILYQAQEKLTDAMKLYEEALEINRSIGNRHWMAKNLGLMGDVCSQLGEYEQGLECYRQKGTICREIGDRFGAVIAIGSTGIIYSDRGEYDEALECYRQVETICREIGDRIGTAIAIGNMGNVYQRRGEYEQALECFRLAVEEHRAIGARSTLSLWLWGTATVLLELVEAGGAEMPEYVAKYVAGATVGTWQAMSVQRARSCVEEFIAIGDELSKPDTQFKSGILLAKIEAAEGRGGVALQHLIRMLENAVEDADRAELHYQLWKLGDSGHAAHALALYEALCTATPKHDYHKRIEELIAAGEHPAGGDPNAVGSSS